MGAHSSLRCRRDRALGRIADDARTLFWSVGGIVSWPQ